MQNLPKFVMADNTDYPDDIFVIHLDYPHFLINLKDDSVTFLEDISDEDQKEMSGTMDTLIDEAAAFYDRELERIESGQY